MKQTALQEVEQVFRLRVFAGQDHDESVGLGNEWRIDLVGEQQGVVSLLRKIEIQENVVDLMRLVLRKRQ